MFRRSIPVICILSILTVISVACMTAPISGKKSMNMLSESEENRMGDEAYADILSKERVMTDPRYVDPVKRAGQRIAAVANKPDYKWEFVVLDSDTVNAFCLPGGKIAFYRGIFDVAQNEGGIAVVMGHEIGHAIARHAGQRMTLNMAMVGGLAVLQNFAFTTATPEKKNTIFALMGMGATVGLALPFSRDNEYEADEIGVMLMARAGYDPAEAPLLWDRFAKLGSGGPEFLSTHPMSEKRRDQLNKLQARAMGDYNRAPAKYGKGASLPPSKL